MIAVLVLVAGGLLNALATLWLVLLLLRILGGWMLPAPRNPGRARILLAAVVEAPVRWVQRLVPTVYRQVDFAPWLTILLLVLLKTFFFRAMLYWGLLHRTTAF